MPIEIESPEEIGYGNIRYNLAESSVKEFDISQLHLDLNQVKMEYTHHRGRPDLRKLIAKEGKHLDERNVLLTGGAEMALYILYTSLLSKEDEVLVLFPNYSSNVEIPNALGLNYKKIQVSFDRNWKIDWDELEKRITPKTKMISLTYPHNPTGQTLNADDIHSFTGLIEKYNLWVLVDETYRDACFMTPYPLLASHSPKMISVISFSKGMGLPGLRMGAIIHQDTILMEKYLAAKELIYIANPPIEEEIAYHFYKDKSVYLKKIHEGNQKNLLILKEWLQQETRVECVLPQGGVVAFPRMVKLNLDMKLFYKKLFDDSGTIVGPGHWFDMPDHYFRIGFGYQDEEAFRLGLNNLSLTLNSLSSATSS